MEMRRLLAWNLRHWRVHRGLSQEQLAVDAGVNRPYVSRIERGLVNPSVDIIGRLARALSIPPADLLVKPAAKDKPPKTLPAGRKKTVKRRGR